MSMALVWLGRARVYTKCKRCGLDHPRLMSFLQSQPSIANRGMQFILPCIKCTEQRPKERDTERGVVYTRQTRVDFIRPQRERICRMTAKGGSERGTCKCKHPMECTQKAITR